MKKIINIFIAIAALAVISTSCVKDLDTVPIDPDEVTAVEVFEDPDSYKQILAKLYAGLSVSGQEGPSGDPDILGIDEGFGQYMRGYWYHQELTTDEALIAWNDQTIKNFHGQSWTSSDVFITAFYYRIFYQIAACNEYIRETTDAKLDGRGVTGDLRTDVEFFRAEARFLRAVSYWHAIDLFANVPFVTENDPVGAFFPEQIMRADLFNYVESELLEIEGLLREPLTNPEYGRVDQAAAWMLLAKLYLNATVYTGSPRYDKAVEYSEKVINSGYTLDDNYENIFLADNHTSPEIIFPITFDGLQTQTWGGTTFIINASVGGAMNPADYGIGGGWGGTRTTSAFVRKFYPDITESSRMVLVDGRSTNNYPILHVPGSYQGWDPSNDSTVLASVNSDQHYEGYLYFLAGDKFKFTPQPDWQPINWGDNDADGTLEKDGADIEVAEAGYYKINVDTTEKTYTMMATRWGVIGSATPTGWDSDTDMEFDMTTGMWTVVLDLTEGAMKFRANDDWGLNYGDNDFNGILSEGGADIPVAEAGTYLIKLKLGHPDYTYTVERAPFDRRAMFFTDGQNLEIEDVSAFTDGWAVTKFKNVTSDGASGSDLTHSDTDFPMFRLADAYLMYAEAVKRGGGGSEATALNLVNALITRAYNGATDGNITAQELTLDFILDERARELYWECHRRTDLVRYGKFTGDAYLWPWKGNAAQGIGTNAKFDIFPLPSSDVNANSNLSQNDGY
jgi:hypothetical protein